MRTEIRELDGRSVLVVAGDGDDTGVGALWLDVDQALDLFGRLSGLLPDLAKTAPELRRHPFIREDDGEAEESWVCPRCDHTIAHEELVELDSHQGWNTGDLDGDSLYIVQGQTELATMAFLCDHCRKTVSIPGEIEVTWS